MRLTVLMTHPRVALIALRRLMFRCSPAIKTGAKRGQDFGHLANQIAFYFRYVNHNDTPSLRRKRSFKVFNFIDQVRPL